MKKIIAFVISIVCVFSLVGRGEPKDNEVKKTIEGNVKTYCEMERGIAMTLLINIALR